MTAHLADQRCGDGVEILFPQLGEARVVLEDPPGHDGRHGLDLEVEVGAEVEQAVQRALDLGGVGLVVCGVGEGGDQRLRRQGGEQGVAVRCVFFLEASQSLWLDVVEADSFEDHDEVCADELVVEDMTWGRSVARGSEPGWSWARAA
jgi:hypothetical protein